MKKLLLTVLVLLMVPALCYAPPAGYCISSGIKAVGGGNVAISTVPAKLCGVIVTTNGSNNAQVEVYDSATAASGTALFNMTVVAADYRGGAIFPKPIAAMTGLYLDFNSCTGCSAVVYYEP